MPSATSVLLSPVDALDALFELDRKVALPIVAGLAVLSAATIVRAWHISFDNFGTAALIGVYVVGLGALVVIVASAIQTDWLARLLGAALAIAIILLIVIFSIDVFFRPAWLQPPWCVARFMTPCDVVEHDILKAHGAAITASVDVPKKIDRPNASPSPQPLPSPAGGGFPTSVPSPTPTPVDNAVAAASSPRVYIQYAGLITRDAVGELNESLRRGGWLTQDKDGERKDVAAGLNEVRYGRDEDAAAAQALADAVTATGITSRPVVARKLAKVAPNLELWISN